MIFLFDFTLFVIDLHHIMLISLFPTPFEHFHFDPTLGLEGGVPLLGVLDLSAKDKVKMSLTRRLLVKYNLDLLT